MNQVAKAGRGRNSSIELLRMFAVFMIVGHHFVVHNAFDILKVPLSFNKLFLEAIMVPGGKIGVVVFFSISAWFLCMEEKSVQVSLRRIWLLERETLFWSVVLLSVFMIFGHVHVALVTIARSFFPLLTGLWWFATSYAVFILLHTYLNRGLKSMGRGAHAGLCVTTIIMWGLIAGLLPKINLDMSEGLLSFTYLYILISFYRWYMKPLSAKTAFAMIGCGWLLLTTNSVVGGMVYEWGLRRWPSMQTFLSAYEWKLPEMLIGLGLLVLATNFSFSSRVINKLATSAFAVYLISDYSLVREFIWTRVFNLESLYESPWLVPMTIGIVLFVSLSCMILDFGRQELFKLTIDRRKARWFNLAYSRVTHLGVLICEKVNINKLLL